MGTPTLEQLSKAGKIGGKVANQRLTKQQRSVKMRKAAAARWNKWWEMSDTERHQRKIEIARERLERLIQAPPSSKSETAAA